MTHILKSVLAPEKGTWVLLSFIAFFGVIVLVNSIFITNALRTHSGVVTDQPYEKGLAFNTMAEAAKNQPKLQQTALYQDGVLKWSLQDVAGIPVTADVTATLVWPVRKGFDHQVNLQASESAGIYQTVLDLPKKGQWSAHLKASWQGQSFQTRYTFIAR